MCRFMFSYFRLIPQHAILELYKSWLPGMVVLLWNIYYLDIVTYLCFSLAFTLSPLSLPFSPFPFFFHLSLFLFSLFFFTFPFPSPFLFPSLDFLPLQLVKSPPPGIISKKLNTPLIICSIIILYQSVLLYVCRKQMKCSKNDL